MSENSSPAFAKMSTQSAQMTGWRSSATDAPYLVAHLQRFRAQILRDYPLRDIIVLGMGGSALGARVMIDQHAAQLQQLGVRIRIVDTTEPSTIARKQIHSTRRPSGRKRRGIWASESVGSSDGASGSAARECGSEGISGCIGRARRE